jgi:pimeloyl-ACP methyl ester carboxylesterase
VLGEGPLDLVYANGLTEHIDLQWDHSLMARFLERLASFSRLIMFDRRGAGASDPVPLKPCRRGRSGPRICGQSWTPSGLNGPRSMPSWMPGRLG